MTDEELLRTVSAAIAAQTEREAKAQAALAAATPEIERRLVERMRKWALTLPETQAEALLNDLDAFAKENQK